MAASLILDRPSGRGSWGGPPARPRRTRVTDAGAPPSPGAADAVSASPFGGPLTLRRCSVAWLPLLGLLVLALEGTDAGWRERTLAALPAAVLLPFLCLGFWWAAAMNPLGATPARRFVVTHLGGALAGSAVWWMLSSAALRLAVGAGSPEDALLGRHRTWLLLLGVVAYLVVLLVHGLLSAQEASAAASLRREESLRLAREAELAALRLQIHPHFLFNALHSISALTAVDAGRARDMTVRLAEFLRRNLRLGDRERVDLAQELELVDDYLALEALRFGERLVVERDVDADLSGAPVPPLLLQPLVENAVKHGLSSLTGPMTLRLTVRRANDELLLGVENDHDPTAVAATPGAGVGLVNTERRLARLRGDDEGLRVRDEDGRFCVTLRLPLEDAR